MTVQDKREPGLEYLCCVSFYLYKAVIHEGLLLLFCLFVYSVIKVTFMVCRFLPHSSLNFITILLNDKLIKIR